LRSISLPPRSAPSRARPERCPDQFGLKDLRQRLGELGYIEGRNIVIECRAAPGKWEELPELAAELVRLNIDVLVTEGTPASLAAKQATRLVPIIMVYVGDPVASGLVSSLGRQRPDSESARGRAAAVNTVARR